MDVGGAVFSTIKHIISKDCNEPKTPTATNEAVLVAKGKSHLSHFDLGACSSVLYLAPEANSNAILFLQNDNDDAASDNLITPIALEIYHHTPIRAVDLQRATRTFIKNNLRDDNKHITDLPLSIQHQLARFDALYQNVNIGDRYVLQYIPGIGMSLFLNNKLLGTAGSGLTKGERRDLARMIFSVWCGQEVPFSEMTKKTLLTPFEHPAEIPALALKGVQHDVAWNDNSANGNHGRRSSSTAITEEERALFASLGLMQLLEEESGSFSENLSESPPYTKKQPQPLSRQASKSSFVSQQVPALTRAQHYFFPPKQSVNVQSQHRTKNSVDEISAACLETDTSHNAALSSSPLTIRMDETRDESRYNPILLGLGGAAFLLPHLIVLLSLPPVLRGRGAPYLPTFGGKLNTMFDLIRGQALLSRHTQIQPIRPAPPLRFVDLGSGDGRVVFRAAREGLFAQSVGYEINPALHLLASCRRWVTPRYWSSTRFSRRDLWKIKLHQYDVVAVYGLSPIMERLGKKLEKELKPGSVVVSNVFQIPGWKVNTKNRGKGVYLYCVPECFGGNDKNRV